MSSANWQSVRSPSATEVIRLVQQMEPAERAKLMRLFAFDEELEASVLRRKSKEILPRIRRLDRAVDSYVAWVADRLKRRNRQPALENIEQDANGYKLRIAGTCLKDVKAQAGYRSKEAARRRIDRYALAKQLPRPWAMPKKKRTK